MQEKQLLLKQMNIWKAFVDKAGNIEKHIEGEYDIVEEAGALHNVVDEPMDTVLYYEVGKKSLPFTMLTKKLSWNNENYLLTTYTSSREISHLVIKVFTTEAVILLLLLIAIVVLNQISSRALWKPFFSTMQKLDDFDVTKSQSVKLPSETGTKEFDELNKVVEGMVANTNTAYHNQKQFVENASHEMQTPLAIIRSKLELLINQPNLTERNASLLADISEANNRLSQMNRILLLLAKIENNQFPETESVNLSGLLKKLIAEFKNHYDDFPETTMNIKDDVMLNANRSLIDIMVTNLLKNAIVHNKPLGKIKITLNQSNLLIENTGSSLTINPDELFERFKKGSHETKTTGLGLALVRQICNLYQFTATYSYDNDWHRISVTFA
ncbi:MAG: GHKL domain-containing protein [Chitinophagaceae bacterium]|nr:GHKL domain-containing protein [Chitinophagaceae bacterium]